MLINAAVSIFGWFFFEYFDYFALGNWYYPNSTMPLLGYFGYLPFGILAWVIFIWAGKVFGFDTDLLQMKIKIDAIS
ncbi:MAG: hypothetical protein ABIP37_01200 [Methylotenera sp.]